MSLLERFQDKRPKRILALDGGGIRGQLSLGILDKMEAVLSHLTEKKRDDFRLSEYFDLICGTSTGAATASALALGKSVEEIKEWYAEVAEQVFPKPTWFEQAKSFTKQLIFRSSPKYPSEPLVSALQKLLDGHTLSSPALRTGLLIFVKRLDKFQTWGFHNHPNGKFNLQANGPYRNTEYTLSRVVTASAAAPFFFRPEHLTISGQAQEGVFVDGGASPFNSPALGALICAASKETGFKWTVAPESMLLVSVGTGWIKRNKVYTRKETADPMNIAGDVAKSIVLDSDWLNQTLLQWMSNSPTRERTHPEIGDLNGELLAGRPLLSYLRYNVEFTAAEKDLIKIDEPSNGDKLYRKGSTVVIDTGHFPEAFNYVYP